MHTITVPPDISIAHLVQDGKLNFRTYILETLMTWRGWRRPQWVVAMADIGKTFAECKVGEQLAVEDAVWEKLCTCINEHEINSQVVLSVQPFMLAVLHAPKGEPKKREPERELKAEEQQSS